MIHLTPYELIYNYHYLLVLKDMGDFVMNNQDEVFKLLEINMIGWGDICPVIGDDTYNWYIYSINSLYSQLTADQKLFYNLTKKGGINNA